MWWRLYQKIIRPSITTGLAIAAPVLYHRQNIFVLQFPWWDNCSTTRLIIRDCLFCTRLHQPTTRCGNLKPACTTFSKTNIQRDFFQKTWGTTDRIFRPKLERTPNHITWCPLLTKPKKGRFGSIGSIGSIETYQTRRLLWFSMLPQISMLPVPEVNYSTRATSPRYR